jgi:hypothetical protein
MIASLELGRELAILQPGVPVLSLHVRTDPREPANTAATPKWLVELRNGLREVVDTADERESRSERLARRELCAWAEREALGVDHLVFVADATPDPEALPPHVRNALGKPSAGMVVERTVVHAVASGADVTAVSEDLGRLLSVGGVVATLRY